MNKGASILYPATLIILFGLLFFTSVGEPSLFDPDEAATAAISRTMLATGEWVIPALNGEDFLEQPPLLYWSQVLGYRIFGVSPMGARFCNTAAAVLTIMVCYFGTAAALTRRSAFSAALVLGSSIFFGGLARLALSGDMLLTFFLVSGLMLFWRGVEHVHDNKNGAPLFWAACLAAGLAMLTDSAGGWLLFVPTVLVYLVSIGRPALILDRRWLLPGTIILVLAGLCWYLLLTVRHTGGFDFARELFVVHLSRMLPPGAGSPGSSLLLCLAVLLIGDVHGVGILAVGLNV